MRIPPLTNRDVAALRTRQRLLDVGCELAETVSLEQMSVNLLVDEAGVSKGTFFHHFGDRAAYLVELHRRFHDTLVTEISAVVSGLAPGLARLEAIATAYLDACLRMRGVKALLLQARSSRELADEVLKRNAATAEVLRADFAAMSWPEPAASARIWTAMLAEAALVEQERAGEHPATRACLRRFVAR